MRNLKTKILYFAFSSVLISFQNVYAQVGMPMQSLSGQGTQGQTRATGQSMPMPAQTQSKTFQNAPSSQGMRSVPGKNNEQISDSITQSQISDSVTQSKKK